MRALWIKDKLTSSCRLVLKLKFITCFSFRHNQTGNNKTVLAMRIKWLAKLWQSSKNYVPMEINVTPSKLQNKINNK